MSPAPRGQNTKKIALRYLFFTLGLLINSFGIARITKGALGTSPISSTPYVLSLQFPTLSFGMDFAIASVSFQDYSSVTLPSASFSTFMPDTGM